MEDPQEDPLAVHCFCVCSGSALLGDLLGVSRSMERDLLSVLSIYPRIFLQCIHCVSSVSMVSFCVVIFYYMFMCVSCFGLVVSTCQVIGYRKTLLMTRSWGEEIISTKPRWKSVFVCIFILFVSSMSLGQGALSDDARLSSVCLASVCLLRTCLSQEQKRPFGHL